MSEIALRIGYIEKAKAKVRKVRRKMEDNSVPGMLIAAAVAGLIDTNVLRMHLHWSGWIVPWTFFNTGSYAGLMAYLFGRGRPSSTLGLLTGIVVGVGLAVVIFTFHPATIHH